MNLRAIPSWTLLPFWSLVVIAYALFSMLQNQVYYWIGALLSITLLIFSLTRAEKEHTRLIAVILFALSLKTLLVMKLAPWGFSAFQTDSSYDLQLSNLIIDQGRWTPGQGTLWASEYSYYPAVHLWTASIAQVAGIDAFTVARIFILVAPMLILAFYYLAIRTILPGKIATLAALIYAMNTNFILFDNYVLESLGLLFFSMCLFVFLKLFFVEERTKQNGVLWTMGLVGLAISHHWSSYNFLAFLLVFFAVPALLAYSTLKKTTSNPPFPTKYFILAFAVVFLWILAVSSPIFSTHVGWFGEFIANMTQGGARNVAPLFGRSSIEVVLIYAGEFILFSLGILQLRKILFTHSTKIDGKYIFLSAWFLFSISYLVVATFMAPKAGAWVVLSRRNWEFTYFGIAPLVSLYVLSTVSAKNFKSQSLAKRFRLNKLQNIRISNLKIFVLIFPLLSTFLLPDPSFRGSAFPVSGNSFYSVSIWFKTHMPNQSMVSDPILGPVVLAYAATTPEGPTWTLVATWPGTSDLMVKIYNTREIYSFKNIVYNNKLAAWYPDFEMNNSAIDLPYNRVYDSSTVTIFARALTAVRLYPAENVTESSLRLSWTKNTDADFKKYVVHQSSTAGEIGTAVITITNSSSTSCGVTGLSANTTYYLTIRVYDTGGRYADSNQIAATTSALVSEAIQA